MIPDLLKHPLLTNPNFSGEFKQKLLKKLQEMPEQEPFEIFALDGRKMSRDRLSCGVPHYLSIVDRVFVNFYGTIPINFELQMPPYNPPI
jgi:hypothetical protein